MGAGVQAAANDIGERVAAPTARDLSHERHALLAPPQVAGHAVRTGSCTQSTWNQEVQGMQQQLVDALGSWMDTRRA